MLNGGRASAGHRSPARDPFLPVFHDFQMKNQRQTWLITKSLWSSRKPSFSPSQRIAGFRGWLPPSLGIHKHVASCAEVRRPPDTPAVHWDPAGRNSRMNTEAASLCYGPRAYDSVTAASISFLMLGICYQSCPLLVENQMTQEGDQSAL